MVEVVVIVVTMVFVVVVVVLVVVIVVVVDGVRSSVLIFERLPSLKIDKTYERHRGPRPCLLHGLL